MSCKLATRALDVPVMSARSTLNERGETRTHESQAKLKFAPSDMAGSPPKTSRSIKSPQTLYKQVHTVPRPLSRGPRMPLSTLEGDPDNKLHGDRKDQGLNPQRAPMLLSYAADMSIATSGILSISARTACPDFGT